MVPYPICQESNQLITYKRGWGVELENTDDNRHPIDPLYFAPALTW